MANIICSVIGHKWYTSEKESHCVRCNAVCRHEKKISTSPCYDRCQVCNAGIAHHSYVLKENGELECTVCHCKSIDLEVCRAYNEKLSKIQENDERQRAKSVYDSFMSSHKLSETARGVEDNQFLCMYCEKVMDKGQMSSVYKRPICKSCANKLKKYSGHLVMDKIDGYKRTVTCINCFQSEDWEDAEHQGTLLSDLPCGLSYIPGDNEAKLTEAFVNSDEGIY